jgi:glycosyltransferase involved in cell wall biosynthesis
MAFIATSREAALIGARHEVRPIVVPNAVALPPLTSRAPGAGTFLFVGGFGYFPNLDAALWIVEAIVPALRQRLGAAASVTLVGRNAPERLTTRAARAGVRILGAAEDLAPVYAEACAALVPLRAGGGSRIKLLEAAAHGVPVVATTLGAEDSGLEDGRHIWIADTPEAIADACAAIRRNPETAAQRAASAYAFVAEARERTAAISTLRAHFATSIATAHENTGGGRF